MISKQQRLSLFVNSLGIFLLSFICIKVIILLVKYFIAWSFSIDTTLVNFRLMGISPADSGAWTTTSVRIFYGADIVVPLIVFFWAFFLFQESLEKPTNYKIGYLWIGFLAIHSSCSATVAGIVTHTNVFHFLQWCYIPYFIMMLIAFGLLPMLFIFGWFYNRQYLIASPIESEESQLTDQRTVLFYCMALPVLAGSFFLFLIISFFFHKYDFFEFFVLSVMTIPALLYFYPHEYLRPSQNFSTNMNLQTLIVALSAGVLFLIFTLITHFIA